MKTIQRTKQYIFSIIIIAFAVLIVPAFAYAQAPLEVVFDPDPLFDVENFLPGDEVSGEVTVTNNSGEEQDVIVEAINVSDDDGLGGQLEIIITINPTIYSGNFGIFLTSGEVPLTTLSDGETETYTFTISFIDSSDDSYQGKTLGFDLCVGFEGGDSHCGDTIVGDEETFGDGNGGGGDGGGTIPGSGGGGGGGGGPLVITGGPDVEILSDTSVRITWETNYFSTSQVVYSSSAEPHTLDLGAPFYGYAHGAPDPASNNKIADHSINLTGLLAGTEYFYRVVSSASPPTISKEHSLTTSGTYVPPTPSDGILVLGNEDENVPSAEEGTSGSGNTGGSEPEAGTASSDGSESGNGSGSLAQDGTGQQEQGSSELSGGRQTGSQITTGGGEIVDEENGRGLAAATFFGFSGWSILLLLLILALIAAWLLFVLYRRRQK